MKNLRTINCTMPDSTNFTLETPHDLKYHSVYGVVHLLIFLIGVPLNSYLFYYYYKNRAGWTPRYFRYVPPQINNNTEFRKTEPRF